MALIEAGLYFGKGDRVNDERGKVHPGVPIAIKESGVAVTPIPISHVPNYRGEERGFGMCSRLIYR